MPYSIALAASVRGCLSEIPDSETEEKKMFSALNFMVNGKTCVSVSGEKLMVRFAPQLQKKCRSGVDTKQC
jgi:hypothetical protein